jgi:predicted metal-dependent phosphoesterase TrpH/glycosyltransferase involved in cell wall biosynthesis
MLGVRPACSRAHAYAGFVSERLRIAHVTPHSWGVRHEVNDYAARMATELGERGHEVVVAAPSESRADVRRSRAAIEAARGRPAALIDGAWDGPRAGGDRGPKVLAVGSGLPMPRGPRPRAAPVPLDMSRTLERLLSAVEFDLVHVHDPFAPSAASTALRHSRSLNVATFHEPTERILSTQVARPLVEIFFGRLDARTASSATTRELMERFFPGTYESLEPGADAAADPWWPSSSDPKPGDGPVRIAYSADEERGALRLLLRALRKLPLDAEWEVAIFLPEPRDLRLSRRLRERVFAVGPKNTDPIRLAAAADVVCATSGGPRTATGVIRAGLATGAVPVVSHLPIYQELVADGEAGLLFQPGDAVTLAAQLERLMREPGLRNSLLRSGRGRVNEWSAAAQQAEAIYLRLTARRHDVGGNGAVRRRVARRGPIHVDLHMHTDHSPDCATPVEVLLETARERGLGAIAITDHNEISGALAAREVAEGMDGIEVIVGEEVKTAEQGEVIGLFLEEKIQRGMTMAETIAEIRRQNGLVYVPHPFDRLHSVPDYEHLLDMVEEIDILEVFNPRVALTAFNEEAERFAAKYRIVPGAGSDSHVAQGLGSVMIRLHEFEGPGEFLEAMRDADIVRKHKNLVYVQALKFLQTSGGRGGRRGSGRSAARRRAAGAPRARKRAGKG